jgi:cytochrome b6-f complex iron-sulfur subunit
MLVHSAVAQSLLVCCSSGGGSGGQTAKDALGNDVKVNEWLATHAKGDRSLVQGLKVGTLRPALL